MNLPSDMSPDRIPGLKPPPGVTPNFVNPENYQNTIVAALVVCLTVATLFTALRLYVKIFVIKSIALEDYTSFLAWAGFVAYTAVFAATLQYGNGIHQWNVSLSDVLKFGKLTTAVEGVYYPSIYLVKLTILLQIMHIFVTSRKSTRFYILQILIWVNALYYLLNILFMLFACTPRAKLWSPMLPVHCAVSYNVIHYVVSIFSAVSDIVILLTPILWVWKLQMPLKRKVGVSLVFASDIFACLSSILRLVAFIRWGKNPDITWHLSHFGLWTLGEFASGIMCGSLPNLPRAMAQLSSNFSHLLSPYRSAVAEKLGSSREKFLSTFEIRKPSVSLRDHFEEELELRAKGGVQSNQRAFWEPPRGEGRSDFEQKFPYSAV